MSHEESPDLFSSVRLKWRNATDRSEYERAIGNQYRLLVKETGLIVEDGPLGLVLVWCSRNRRAADSERGAAQ